MVHPREYDIFRYFMEFDEIIPHVLLLCALAILILIWFGRSANSSKPLGRPVPGLKVRMYSVYGNLDLLPSFAKMQSIGLPTASFLLLNVLGHGLIFQKEGIFSYRLGFAPNVVLTKAEHVEALLTSTVFLEKGVLYNMLHRWLGTGLLTSYGSKWKSRRKLLTHSFHFDILKDFLPVFDEQSKILVDILKQRTQDEWVDIVHLITLCSLDIICDTTLGVHVGAQRDSSSEYVQAVLCASQIVLERATNPILHYELPFRLSSLGRRFKKDVECLHNFTRKVIQEKKEALNSAQCQYQDSVSGGSKPDQFKKKKKALMDLLLDVHLNHQEFTEEDIREEIDTFAFEGHDTTSVGMSWALYLIGLYPDIQSNIHQELDAIYGDDRDSPVTVEDIKEMKYLERVLKESQRLYPSVPFFSRRAHKDFTLCGYEVKKDTTLVVNSYILHRNPEAFPNPEKFDPDRFLPENCVGRHPFAYVPFSAGPRNCIGQRFAMMEEKTVVSNVLRNFSVKSLEQRDKVFPAGELVLRSPHPLKVKFTPRETPS